MPFRLGEGRATCKFLTSAQMPSLLYQACMKTGTPSATRYMQETICARLADDLDLDLDELLAALPPTRRPSLDFRSHRMPGPCNTVEEVR